MFNKKIIDHSEAKIKIEFNNFSLYADNKLNLTMIKFKEKNIMNHIYIHDVFYMDILKALKSINSDEDKYIFDQWNNITFKFVSEITKKEYILYLKSQIVINNSRVQLNFKIRLTNNKIFIENTNICNNKVFYALTTNVIMDRAFTLKETMKREYKDSAGEYKYFIQEQLNYVSDSTSVIIKTTNEMYSESESGISLLPNINFSNLKNINGIRVQSDLKNSHTTVIELID